MAVTDAIKRVPRQAWYAGAGIGGGIILIRMWSNRGGGASSDGSGDPAVDSTGGTASVSPSPTGVIVPPVIIPPADSNDNSGELASLFVDATNTVLSYTNNLTSQVFGQNAQLIDSQGSVIDQLFSSNDRLAEINSNSSDHYVDGLLDLIANGGAGSGSHQTTPVTAPTTTKPAPKPVQTNRGQVPNDIYNNILKNSGAWYVPWLVPAHYDATAYNTAMLRKDNAIAQGYKEYPGGVTAWGRAHGWKPWTGPIPQKK